MDISILEKGQNLKYKIDTLTFFRDRCIENAKVEFFTSYTQVSNDLFRLDGLDKYDPSVKVEILRLFLIYKRQVYKMLSGKILLLNNEFDDLK
jgi:hypothetical protein